MGKHAMKIKKGDTVKVIAGKDKGAEGKVILVLREEQRVIVEGVNRVKKHTKVVNQGGRAGTTGGIITTEAPIHVSNVMLVEGNGVTRVGYRREEVQKRRPDGSTYAGTRMAIPATIRACGKRALSYASPSSNHTQSLVSTSDRMCINLSARRFRIRLARKSLGTAER